MSKDRRLGRGLAALLGSPLEETLDTSPEPSTPAPIRTAPRLFDEAELVAETEVASTGDTGLLQLAVAEIQDNPFQPPPRIQRRRNRLAV